MVVMFHAEMANFDTKKVDSLAQCHADAANTTNLNQHYSLLKNVSMAYWIFLIKSIIWMSQIYHLIISHQKW